MKKLFFKNSQFFLAIFLVISFFAPNLIKEKVPIPADSILGLYHPFRDIGFLGFNPGKFPIKNPFINDSVLQTYPLRKVAIENVKKFNIPLWNPYSFSGQPLFGDIQTGLLQVNNILFIFFPFKLFWSSLIILSSVLLSVFTFLFLKEIKISNTAAAYGAFIIPFVGFFLPWSTWGTIVTTALWLPLILLSISKILKKFSPMWLIILVLSLSQTIFSGHAQTALYIYAISIFYSFFNLKKEKNIKKSAVLLLAFSFSLIISSVQIFPFIELIKNSARSTDQYFYPGKIDWFLPVQNLIQIVSPDFFGNPTTNNYWGIWNYWEFVTYIGIFPLIFAVYAILKKREIFFIVIVIISLTFALKNPISLIPYNLNIPLISTLQPSRVVFLLVFSLVVLAAKGMDEFLSWKKDKIILITPVLTLFLILSLFILAVNDSSLFFNQEKGSNQVAIRNLILPFSLIISSTILLILKNTTHISKKIIVTTIFLLTIFDLFRFAYKFTPFTKTSLIFPSTKTTDFLREQQKPFRVMTTDRRIFHPNVSGIYNIESIDGYNPLYLNNYAKLISVLQSHNPKEKIGSFNRIITPQKLDEKLLKLLNVKYVLTFDDIQNPSYEKVFEEGETKTYLYKEYIPRAYYVSRVEKLKSDEEEFSALLEEDFNLSKFAVSKDFSYTAKTLNPYPFVQSYDDNHIVLLINTSEEAPLIVQNINYPGWNAYIDGEKVKINEANYAFQSITTPKGEHKVEFKFEPKSFYNGFYISMAGLISFIVFTLFTWRKNFQ